MKLGALNLTLQHLIEHSFGCDFEMKHEQNILVLEAGIGAARQTGTPCYLYDYCNSTYREQSVE
jgi:hypothetical protein